MIMEYNFSEIEQKWQQRWKETNAYKVSNDSQKPKYYVLDMFPYPSGAGLHVGHPLGYIASDIFSRYKRLKGYNVLHPMGYDAFGLPAEQYAIEHGIHPAVSTKKNIETFRGQLDKIGFCYDWDREVRTCEPDYYKHTQWIFLQLFNSFFNRKKQKAEPIGELIASFDKEGNNGFEMPNQKFQIPNFGSRSPESFIFTGEDWKGFDEATQQTILMEYRLAYCGYGEVNWCEALGTVLANDEVVNGVSERGGHPVVKKKLRQWYLRITEYADRLLQGLETIDFSDAMKEMQTNWIGKSYGAEIDFRIRTNHTISSKIKQADKNIEIEEISITEEELEETLRVYTTRPDTIFGVDFMVVAPEHDLVKKISSAEQLAEVEKYLDYVNSRSERERQAEKKISGCFTGAYAINPFDGREIPIWISEYVLAGYGTGAIMGVPCGDERDHKFAQHFGIGITNIIGDYYNGVEANATKDAILQNSGFLDGMVMRDASDVVISKLEEMGIGKRKVNYKMRDAAFSRQRYWGEPFPIVWKEGVAYPLSESELPLKLPEVESYSPGPEGEGPLANIPEWSLIPFPSPGEKGAQGLTGSLNGSGESADDIDFRYMVHSPVQYDLAKEMRKDQTKAENVLWEELRDHKLGVELKFRRQHPIDAFIVDFICIPKKLIVEVDGGYHENEEQRAYDEERTKRLNELGFEVIRFTNEEVINNTNQVLKAIAKKTVEFDQNNINQPEVNQQSQTGAPLSRGEGLGVRETNTMPGYAGSSWYFLRYMDPSNATEFASRAATDYWNQVDLYVGGTEHAVGHLLYSRMWTKALFDLGYIGFDEPFKKLLNQGMIQGSSRFVYRINGTHTFVSKGLLDKNETYKGQVMDKLHADVNFVDGYELDIEAFKKWRNGEYANAEFIFEDGSSPGGGGREGSYICGSEVEKMSKSKFNTVNPDDLVAKYGADTFRMYEMFLGPVEISKPWDTKGIEGVHRFIKKLWRLFYDENKGLVVTNDAPNAAELKVLHKAIKKIEDDTERYSFNTAVSAFMIAVNDISDLKCHKRAILEQLVTLLVPYAPHISEELWHAMGNTTSVLDASFPVFNAAHVAESSKEYPVSINGKVRTNMSFPLDAEQSAVQEAVLANELVQKWMEGKEMKKLIFVKGKMINVVV